VSPSGGTSRSSLPRFSSSLAFSPAYLAEPASGAGGDGDGDARIAHAVEARCTGTLAAQPRGDGGFGYDPAFVPDDLPGNRTMAELDPGEKDAISHRGRAARELLALLEG